MPKTLQETKAGLRCCVGYDDYEAYCDEVVDILEHRGEGKK